jgi:hypothetical protein
MNREELFKKNFPEYVTEKGMCLSPYWDIFCAGLKAGEETSKKNISTEDMLKELLDRKVIKSWYYNGKYHVGNELS